MFGPKAYIRPMRIRGLGLVFLAKPTGLDFYMASQTLTVLFWGLNELYVRPKKQNLNTLNCDQPKAVRKPERFVLSREALVLQFKMLLRRSKSRRCQCENWNAFHYFGELTKLIHADWH